MRMAAIPTEAHGPTKATASAKPPTTMNTKNSTARMIPPATVIMVPPLPIFIGPGHPSAHQVFGNLKVQPLQQSETQQAVENQEQRYDEVEESRHDQDQNARNERDDRRDDRRDVGDRQGHLKALRDSDRGKSIRARIILGEMAEWEARRKARHLDELDFGHANQFQFVSPEQRRLCQNATQGGRALSFGSPRQAHLKRVAQRARPF